MGCVNVAATPIDPATVSITPPGDVTVNAALASGGPTVTAELVAEGPKVTAAPVDGVTVEATPVEGVSVFAGEVCSITPGTLVVLAASDGPLRTRDGGYLLLDPARNPPEN